ncbi:hypothetical protein LguiB_001224 [Lonicera macranthoides]
MYEPSGKPPNQNSSNPNPNPNPETDQIPPDPLLEPGTFIAGNINGDPDTTGEVNHSESDHTEPSRSEEEGKTRPVSDFTTETTGDTPPARRQKRGSDEAAGAIPPAMMERPDWLPEGWRMDFRVRSSGVSAGSVDRYYIEPANGRRFRSKKEVLYFLETGEKQKKRATPDGPDATPSPGGKEKKEKKEKKSSSKTKKPPPINFDFNHPPETVSWTFTDTAKDTWDPSVGEEKVAESTKKEWAAVFDHICQIQSRISGS